MEKKKDEGASETLEVLRGEGQKPGVVPNPDDAPQTEGVVPNPDDPPADEEGDEDGGE